MSRKFFRRFRARFDAVRDNRHIARLGPWLQHPKLWNLNRRSVAGGVAAGLFTGLIPGSNPVQFTAAAVAALALRVNLPVAVLVTLYSNPFTIVPLYFAAFKLGQLALLEGGAEVPPLHIELEGRRFNEWVPAVLELLAGVGKPLLIGLPLLAVLLAVIGYCAVDWTWRLYVLNAWRNRRRRAAQP